MSYANSCIMDQFNELYYLIQDRQTTVNHVAEFFEIYHAFGLTAFLCSAVEKKNYMQICLYFQNTLKDGGCDLQKSAILEILEHENRQLYFSSNDTSNFFKSPDHIVFINTLYI
ncbi:hypothetical protein RhiirC2_795790 [Rhizophagus irregularis]|uniref:Uncharacterized protein n=1 Tax=Rhizophagus irregularis TaxID=588596 RepID=A0A2N1MAX2_9GLOM|nr:hypothetical protein RhiirC2_795790 [Rhizophagus irregularis]